MSSPKPLSTSRDRYLRRTYGITQEDYDRLLKANDGLCWACGTEPKPGKNLHVDHNHKTRRVRALLCWPCNQTLRSYATPDRLIGLAMVAQMGEDDVTRILGYTPQCAPTKRRKKRRGAK